MVAERTTRAYCTHCAIAMNAISFHMSVPRMAANVMAIRMNGSASCTSAQRIKTPSHTPR
jgi:hypothetical protein